VRRAEVEDEADREAAGFEVVQELGFVRGIDRFRRFDLDDDAVVDDQIGPVLADDDSVRSEPRMPLGLRPRTRTF
jgi:hypothetical protein